ncbi:MAG: MipA/OmpV family protein [Rheinheimera sp.]|nr:MipA/OmpV family protein [Rheinheimera sp.]
MSALCRPSRLVVPCAGLLLSLHSAAALADPWQFEAGAGVLSQQQVWKKIPTVSSAIPYFIASNGPWRLGFEQGNLLSYSLVEDENFRLYAGAGIRDNGYDTDTSLSSTLSDDPVFDGYQAPDTEITGSVGLRWYWVSLQLVQQLNEDRNAQVADLALELPLYQHQSGLRLMAVAAASWMNADYTQRIYGVAPGNQNLSVGRPVFQPEAEVNYRLDLRVQYPLSAQTVLLGSAGVTQLADHLQQSPLVDEERSIDAMLLLIRAF